MLALASANAQTEAPVPPAAASQGPVASLPNPLPADLQSLSERVEAAHAPKGPRARVTAVRSDLELHLLDRQASQAGQVDVHLRYLEWQRDERSLRHLIRYSVRQGGKPVETGRDRSGFWHLFQGKPRDLTEADAEDRRACERSTNLVRQLLRFLQPGEVLRALTGPGPVSETTLQIGRGAPVPCYLVRGGLPSFPLLQQSGDDAPVTVSIYVTKAEHRLLALEVQPLRDGKPDASRAEWVRLADLREQDGFLVPRELLHLQAGDDGKLRAISRAVLTTLSLQPGFTPADLDRPKD